MMCRLAVEHGERDRIIWVRLISQCKQSRNGALKVGFVKEQVEIIDPPERDGSIRERGQHWSFERHHGNVVRLQLAKHDNELVGQVQVSARDRRGLVRGLFAGLRRNPIGEERAFSAVMM
jgi:hypothetical protein